MELIYVFHSGFVMEGDEFDVLVDFYKDTDPVIDDGFVHDILLVRERPLYVLSSHFHPDHFNPEVLTWRENKKEITYIFSKDILKRRRAKAEDAIYIKKGEVFEDRGFYVKAFGSTDVGISFYMEFDGKKIFHAGDLNNWHWKDESTPEEVRDADNKYKKELDLIAADIDRLDLVMFPVDARMGSDYELGAKQFIERIPVGLFAPMHFEPDYIKEAQAFESIAEKQGCRFFNIQRRADSIQF